VSAIVVSYNTRDDLLRCLEALHGRAGVSLEAIVVDNASTDGSVDGVRARFPVVRVIANAENIGFSRANNLGLRAARAPFALVLNSDCEVGPGAVETLCAVLEARPDVAIVGPRTVGTDGAPQVSFGPSLTPLAEWRQGRLVRGVKAGQAAALRRVSALAEREQEPDWVSASCFLARRSVLEAVGGFDESFFLYEEDVDLCLRVRQAGGRIVFTPSAEVVHHLGRSMDRAPALARLEYSRSHLRFYAKHNSAADRLALRAWMAGRAAWGWLRAGPGAAGRQRRAEERTILRLALFG
jgi:GT2 family glycosyltransferase